MKKKSKRIIRSRRDLIGRLPCIVSGRRPVVLHHCSGGSMKTIGVHAAMAMKVHDRYIIPLHPDFHTGDYGIHTLGVETWEKKFGTQLRLLSRVEELLNESLYSWD